MLVVVLKVAGVWVGFGCVVLVVLEVVGVRVGLGLCWVVGGFEVCQREGGVWVVLCWWF